MKTLNGPAGSGKTTKLIRIAAETIQAGKSICIASPSIELSKQTQTQFAKSYPQLKSKRIDSDNSTNLSEAISMDIQAQRPHLLLITHESFSRIDWWANKQNWICAIDEEMDMITDLTISVSDPTNAGSQDFVMKWLEQNCSFEQSDNMVVFKLKTEEAIQNSAQAVLADRSDDHTYKVFRDLLVKLTHANWDVNCTADDFQRFFDKQTKKLPLLAEFNVSLLEGFADLYIVGAKIEDTLMAAYLIKKGQQIQPKGFEKHTQPIKIYAYTDQKASSTWLNKQGDNGVTNRTNILAAMTVAVGGKKILVQSNKAFQNSLDIPNREKLPFSVSGMNKWLHVHHYAETGVYNWSPEFIQQLKRRGYDANALNTNRQVNHIYQGLMRTSLRCGAFNDNECHAISSVEAELLKAKYFPNAVIVKINVGTVKTKKVPMTNAERYARYLAKKQLAA